MANLFTKGYILIGLWALFCMFWKHHIVHYQIVELICTHTNDTIVLWCSQDELSWLYKGQIVKITPVLSVRFVHYKPTQCTILFCHFSNVHFLSYHFCATSLSLKPHSMTISYILLRMEPGYVLVWNTSLNYLKTSAL